MSVVSIENLTEAHLQDLLGLYQQAWWSRGRRIDDVRAMLRHSDVTVALADAEDGRLVAFARALTDRTYKAVVFDVIVDDARRGQGLGRMLMDEIVHHPRLEGVQHIELYCLPELVPFYERWGFALAPADLRSMRRAGAL